jgi:hypothetical protein
MWCGTGIALFLISTMRPDFPYKIFPDERASYVLLVQALAQYS